MIPNRPIAPRILVIEDVQETRDAIERLLTTDGYCVDPARDADDAVQRVRLCRPDLILISLAGTFEQRINTARRVRERAGLGHDTPIVIFTVPNIPEGAEEELVGNIFISRPDNFNQLRALLARALQGASPRH
jgi:CheY-like chemotaxis protein